MDREFTKNLSDDRRVAAVVRSVSSLAHDLGMKVTMEGVEDRLQVETVKSSGCDYAQGYFFARPVPAVAMDKHIESYGIPFAQGT
jgi:EAL domain-containing protein (putative c-di-GMP-specific phosphodiesterase class I)